MEKINRLNIGDHLLEYQLAMVGKTIKDAEKEDYWWDKWTITREQEDEFRKYAIPLLKKVFKYNKAKAEYTLGYFILDMGLRVINEENYDKK